MSYLQIGTFRIRRNETTFENTRTVKYFVHQDRAGFTPICLVVGRQRIGKTLYAMKLAETICSARHQPAFDVDKDMFFKIEDLADKYMAYKNRVYILDEAGIDLNVYEGNQLHQRVFQKIIESQAYLHNILFIVLPHARDVGRHHFHHVNAMFSVVGRGNVIFKFIWTRYDELSNKPPFIEEFEHLYGVPLPSAKNLHRYLQVGQSEYKSDILKQQIQQLTDKKMLKAQKFKPKDKGLAISRLPQ